MLPNYDKASLSKQGEVASTSMRHAFTLLETLVAAAVLILLLGFLFSALANLTGILKRSNDQVVSFQEARMAFDSLTRSLRSATLNSYWDYDDVNDPKNYIRQSELHFVIRPGISAQPGQDGIFFQSARSYNTEANDSRLLTGLLNTLGFYIEFGPDKPPLGVPVKYRYRLKQMLLPGSEMTTYASKNPTDFGWFTDYWSESVPLADNIILLRAWPKKRGLGGLTTQSLTSNYSYNSREHANDHPQPETANQMPPLIDLLMVAIDESSALRIASGNTPPSQITSALSGLFQNSTPASFEADLKELEQRLTGSEPPISYRIFRMTIPIEESKWTSN